MTKETVSASSAVAVVAVSGVAAVLAAVTVGAVPAISGSASRSACRAVVAQVMSMASGAGREQRDGDHRVKRSLHGIPPLSRFNRAAPMRRQPVQLLSTEQPPESTKSAPPVESMPRWPAQPAQFIQSSQFKTPNERTEGGVARVNPRDFPFGEHCRSRDVSQSIHSATSPCELISPSRS